MTKAQKQAPAVTHDELTRIVGDIEEAKLAAILALMPSAAEVEEAFLWATGGGDKVDRAGHPLSGVVAQIYEILTIGEEEEEPAPRR